MSYHIYHTEAIILGSRPSGERDRLLYCYTRELGLVQAHAKSLREGRSRLRYALQMFSYAELDLIHGKHGWKLISARPVDSFASLWKHPGRRTIVAQHAQLIRRLVAGEERHEVLFDDILSGLQFLSKIESDVELRAAELVFVVRLLHSLGYWPDKDQFAALLGGEPWNPDTLLTANISRITLLRGVNRALNETQL